MIIFIQNAFSPSSQLFQAYHYDGKVS
jgi:hypothetical protein